MTLYVAIMVDVVRIDQWASVCTLLFKYRRADARITTALHFSQRRAPRGHREGDRPHKQTSPVPVVMCTVGAALADELCAFAEEVRRPVREARFFFSRPALTALVASGCLSRSQLADAART